MPLISASAFFAHQQVVGGDVRLALRTVDDQGVNLLLRAGGEFDCRGEACAAEAADAGLTDFFQQLGGFQVAIVRAGLQGGPLLQAVAVEHDGRRRQARNMGEGLRAYGADGAGGRCMHRHADQTVGGGEELAFENPLTHADARLGGRAQMLAERQDQACG